MRGFLVAAPHSGSGKTTVTLGLLRALRDRDLRAVSAKAGPDYIDPAFHAAATGEDCVNLDPWAMRPALLRSLSWRFLGAGDIAVVEAMMGLFDGAADGTGSAADLAAALRLPVILVIDASRMAHSVAALVKGYRDHRPDVPFAGVILNRVGSPRHETMLRAALEEADIRVFGAVPGDSALSLPSRHLGLVQAGEHEALGDFIARAASMVGDNCDMDALMALATEPNEPRDAAELPPLGQRIAVARDEAFAFAYPHLLTGWQRQGAQLSFFSPLADEGPEPDADAVFLPGGYPELHAGRIAAAATCLDGLRMAANHGKPVYGECGGYMVLGEGLIDADGERHAMAGLLPVVTSYAQRKRHLGYRRLQPLGGSPWALPLTAHEFHYSSLVSEGEGERLFAVRDARGEDLGEAGLQRGSVCGSYMHVIDRAD
ncbi:cobyrinate a,c-diamide synthase [Oricola indica]|uniref:cobyrinate a,c-diamide synthase n=1 Tax=Oricola indica TaxID=2872591 RepID=UPI003CCBEF40